MIRVSKDNFFYALPFAIAVLYIIIVEGTTNLASLTFIGFNVFFMVVILHSLEVNKLISTIFYLLFCMYFLVNVSRFIYDLYLVPYIIFMRKVDSFSDFIVKFTDHDPETTLFCFLHEICAAVGLIFILRVRKQKRLDNGE